MELVDENPDSEETMAQDIDKFGKGSQQGWVMLGLGGDGKTYKHLMSIKNQYGSALQKLLPGDWNILKNFQPVLMKVYYHVGWRELAKSSG